MKLLTALTAMLWLVGCDAPCDRGEWHSRPVDCSNVLGKDGRMYQLCGVEEYRNAQ